MKKTPLTPLTPLLPIIWQSNKNFEERNGKGDNDILQEIEKIKKIAPRLTNICQ